MDFFQENTGFKVEFVNEEESINSSSNKIEFRLIVTDPKKRKDKYKENEAIQFYFEIDKDNADEVALALVATGFLMEEDVRTVALLIRNQLSTLLRNRQQKLNKALQEAAKEAQETQNAQNAQDTQVCFQQLAQQQQQMQHQQQHLENLKQELQKLTTSSSSHNLKTNVDQTYVPTMTQQPPPPPSQQQQLQQTQQPPQPSPQTNVSMPQTQQMIQHQHQQATSVPIAVNKTIDSVSTIANPIVTNSTPLMATGIVSNHNNINNNSNHNNVINNSNSDDTNKSIENNIINSTSSILNSNATNEMVHLNHESNNFQPVEMVNNKLVNSKLKDAETQTESKLSTDVGVNTNPVVIIGDAGK